MRYLVFGDVHANLEALDAVLAAGKQRGVGGYLFVGDLIGYGPNPLGCIERLAALQREGLLAWVPGNHELVVRGEIEPIGYSEEAVRTLAWTRKLVEGQNWAMQFLKSATLTTEVNGTIWLTHDSLAAPSSGGYHRWPQDAKAELACLRREAGRICFYGHTHLMRAELLRAGTEIVLAPMEPWEGHGVDPSPVRLAPDELGWVGTGSTGLPTNAKRWAEFVILDDAEWIVEKYAVAYPHESTRAKVLEVLASPCGAAIAKQIARWF
jgi:predicted phosphodiesterase